MHNIRSITFGDRFNKEIKDFFSSKSLQSLTFGIFFNQKIKNFHYSIVSERIKTGYNCACKKTVNFLDCNVNGEVDPRISSSHIFHRFEKGAGLKPPHLSETSPS